MNDQVAEASGAEEPAPDPRRWPTLVVLLLAGFMNLIDVTIVNVGLPTIQRNLGATSADLEWVVAAYVLAFALGLLPFGRLGDIIGRKEVFLVGIVGFTAMSVACGIAPTIDALVISRALQGLAAAAMMPQALAIVQTIFPARERGTVFPLFGLNAGLAAVAGPLVGGLLITADLFGLDWRPIFLVNLPFGVLAIVVGLLVIPRIPGHAGLKVDWVGIPLAGATVLCLVFALVEGRGYGWPSWIFVLMAAAVPGALAFIAWERRQQRAGGPQLMPISLMRNRSFMVAATMVMALFSAMPSFFMVFAIFLQAGFGFTAFQSGYTTTPMPVGILLASVIGGALRNSFLRGRIAAGCAIVLAGFFWLRTLILAVTDTVDHWQLAPPLLMVGLGMGLCIGAMFQTALSAVPGRDAGAGSGALQSLQQVGMALGVAIGGELFFSSLLASGFPTHAGFVDALGNAFYYQFAAVTVVLVLLALTRASPGYGPPAGERAAGPGDRLAREPEPQIAS